jgi:histidinol dehydrogenase
MLAVHAYPEKNSWKLLLQRPVIENSSLEASVSNILREVKLSGDSAVKKFTSMFDKATVTGVMVTLEDINKAESLLAEDLKQAIQEAKLNIEKFHKAQLQTEEAVETMPGVKCWRKAVAIEKVGLYIPGGTAPLFSTILMLGIPAKIAGCKEIIVCTPADKQGNTNLAILYASKLIGITKIFKVGGAQAIGAMAYGTATIPKVYKIFGPGNQYVTAAKMLVQRDGIAIDMPAGPSEVAVLADESAEASFVAADLLSQAEHGPDSQVILVTTSETLAAKTEQEVVKQMSVLSRGDVVAQALSASKIIIVKTLKQGIEFINEYAPEHLIISCKDDEKVAEQITNAGSVFLGNYSPESVGDYATGTNHTLPTNGYAKAYSGVSVDSFMKKITYQKLSKEGLQTIGKTVELMAEAEGLDGHKNAVAIRLNH